MIEEEKKGKVGQDQIHDLLFSEKLSWQAIIYDLINTEQLDPWDIDLSLLTNKYLEKVRELEEANFFVSSKVLFAAALLLRMKSEILINYDLKSLEELMSGKKEETKKYSQERIELEDDLPELVPRTPLPRHRKVSLPELMQALGKAIKTETRRIKRVVLARQHEIEAGVALPRDKIKLGDEIKRIYSKLMEIFTSRENKLAFSELAGNTGKDKIATFVPLLHLDNRQRVVLEQDGYLEEIWIWLKSLYDKKHSALLEVMRKEVEAEADKLDKEMNENERNRADKLEEIGEPLKDLNK
jgi:segregation and condensation protein A